MSGFPTLNPLKTSLPEYIMSHSILILMLIPIGYIPFQFETRIFEDFGVFGINTSLCEHHIWMICNVFDVFKGGDNWCTRISEKSSLNSFWLSVSNKISAQVFYNLLLDGNPEQIRTNNLFNKCYSSAITSQYYQVRQSLEFWFSIYRSSVSSRNILSCIEWRQNNSFRLSFDN